VAVPTAVAPVVTPAEAVSEPVANQLPSVTQPVAAPINDAPVAEETNTTGDGADTAVWAGLLLSALAAAGLGTVAVAALRRRRKVHDIRVLERPELAADGRPLNRQLRTNTVPTLERPVVNQPISDTLVASSIAAPVAATSPYVAPQVTDGDAREVATRTQPERVLAHSGAAVALPHDRPASVEERRALVERLAFAKPDRANPFRSHKARLHRAKLIVQSLGRHFPEGRSRIDLSQYPMNWPELAPGRPAAA